MVCRACEWGEVMEREDLIRRLQKLRERAQSGNDSECAAAKLLFERILRKYELTEEQIEESVIFDWVERDTEIQLYMNQVCASLGFETGYYLRNKKKIKSKRYVKCTKSEYTIFEDVLWQVRKMYKDRMAGELRAAKLRAKSYMAGFISQTYSCDDPKCPVCSEILVYDKKEQRWKCLSCSYLGRKQKIRHVDPGAYMEGQASSGRLLVAK